MKVIRRSKIAGTIAAPPSKSHFGRVMACALLASGESTLLNPSDCDDARAAVEVARRLGAQIKHTSEGLKITGGRPKMGGVLPCFESGLTFRMFAPIAALFDLPFQLQGEGALLHRPMEMICQGLKALDVECECSGGFAPINLRGPIRGGQVELDGSTTSQFLSGLLIALPLAKNDSQVRVRNLKSEPYVALTLEALAGFGITVNAAHDFTRFDILGRQRFIPGTIVVEGDWSGAAALFAAGAIAGDVTVTGLREDSAQADKAIVDILRQIGAVVSFRGGGLSAAKGSLTGFQVDISHCPDLAPILAAIAATATGRSRISGINRLRYKESDRAKAILEMLIDIGIRAGIEGDALEIHGGAISGGQIKTMGDHRMAMAGALLGLASEGPVVLDDAACVSKSYPGFFDALKILGAEVS